MKKSALLLLFLVTGLSGYAQCPEMTLGLLQNLQRAEEALKESRILEAGFDADSEQAGIHQYRKCWQATVQGKPVFEQLLRWHTASNTLEFATRDKRHFEALRTSITERNSAPGVPVNTSHYTGKMFQYDFDETTIGGVPYYAVRIGFR